MPSLLILNFSHPLTESQISATAQAFGGKVLDVINIKAQFDLNAPSIVPQVQAVVREAIGSVSKVCSDVDIAVNLPSLSIASALVMTMLFRSYPDFFVLRLKSDTSSMVTSFKFAELIRYSDSDGIVGGVGL